MTSTAHEDQFIPEPGSTGWTTREMVNMYASGRAEEREAVVALLLKHGYRQIADALKAGQHLE